jgi:hypothetical protein
VRRYRVSRAANVTRDFDLIEEHSVQVYQELGDDLEDSIERAAVRIDGDLAHMRTFVTHPHRGIDYPRIRPGIRTVTNKSFVFYFEIDEPSSRGENTRHLLRRRGSQAADPGSFSAPTA